MSDKDTIDEILDKYYAPIKLPDINRNGLKQALNLYIEERERLARLDELKHLKQYDSFNKAYTTDTRCATLVDIRIKELEGK